MIILPLDIGGQLYNEVILTEDFTLQNPQELSYGKCKVRNLKELGMVEVRQDKVVVYPKPECLPERKLFERDKPKLKGENYSFFLNYNINLYTQKEPYVVLQPGLFLKGLFATGYWDSQEKLFKNYYLAFDMPERDVRFWGGYVYGMGYSTVSGLYGKGFMVSKKVMSGESPYGTKSFELFLPAKSEVEIYRNGELLQKLELPAGVYDLRNLPVAGLTNEITLRIKDSEGRIREEKIFLLYASTLLRKGATDFAFGLFEKKRLAGFFRYGLTDSITINFAFNDRKQGFGLTGLSRFGTFEAFTTQKDYELGYFTQLYENISLNVSYRNAYRESQPDFRAGLNFSLRKLNLYLYGRKNSTSYVGAILTAQPFRNSVLSVSWSYSENTKHSLGLTFTYLFGRHSLSTFITHSNHTTYGFTAQKQPDSYKYEDWGYRVYTQRTDLKEGESYDVSLYLKALNLFEVNTQKTGSSQSGRLSIYGSVGCVLEGSLYCGTGLPVWDSFLLGKNLESSQGKARSLLPVAGYINIEANSSEGLKEGRFSGALYSGQGYVVRSKDVKVILEGAKTGEVVKVNGEEYVVVDGMVFIENAPEELEIEFRGKTYRVRAKEEVRINP